MTFFFVPFGIFLISVALIIWLIARKFIYLKKLAPGVIDNSDIPQEKFWNEFFPELASKLNSAKLKEYSSAILAEFEKFLRKLRLISLRIDTSMNHLIHKIRKTHANEEILSGEAGSEVLEIKPVPEVTKTKKDPKEEEQKLIIEIAKDPKNPELYKKLGKIYMRTGADSDAFDSFKKALELDPQDSDIQAKFDKIAVRLNRAS